MLAHVVERSVVLRCALLIRIPRMSLSSCCTYHQLDVSSTSNNDERAGRPRSFLFSSDNEGRV